MTELHLFALAGSVDGEPISNRGAHFPPSHRPAGFYFPDRGGRGWSTCSWCAGEMRVKARELAKRLGYLTVCSQWCRIAEVRWDIGTNYHGYVGPVLWKYLAHGNEGKPWYEKTVRPVIERRMPEWEELCNQLKHADELEA